MLQPKRTKWRRTHLIRPHRVATRCNTVAFGEYGLAATEGGYISNKQIEAARVVLSKYTKKVGKSYIRVFPYLGITKKPAEVRMGNGKGQVESWNAVIEKGTVMFEIGGIAKQDAIKALKQAGYKLAVTSRVVKRGEEKL
ncbi:MAG: 50S ribosomal protein L16 [Candidatus Enterosoma sp.]|nr:50S ribosomal protein L16 [Bacilli bacterium]MCI7220257.1 50S ribosomal protein L16 [Bacilli bacterium]MDY3907397.1 50S ribosomal protein L16 [Candidatus Enterosoma sp.]MDY5649961.1 50S ribosomal protein L16 [Candidatus Enterosoma sp.]